MARNTFLIASIALIAPAFWACEDNKGGSAPKVHVAVDTGTVVATVDDRFLSFAVDSSQVVGGHWWSASGDVEPGLGAELCDPYDFARPRLRRMAQALAPAFLRIGGSEADLVYYDLTDNPPEDPPEPYEFTMTRPMWEAACDFAVELGFDIMFTLNAGPGPRDASELWTPNNAEVLIQYTLDRGCPVRVWELGNEINGFPAIHGIDWRIRGDEYALDMAVARDLVDRLHPEAKLAGPSSAFWPDVGEMLPVLPAFMEAGGHLVDVVTWHYYPQQSRRCIIASRPAEPYLLMEPVNLDEVSLWAEHVESFRDGHAPASEVWLGESGNAQCGGEPGVSDRFVASFWWLDQLGLMAGRGQPVVVRQTLSGSNYGLIHDETLEPSPDYWASVLWKRLMGGRVLNAAPTADAPSLRVYAHCTPSWNIEFSPGTFTVLALNLDMEGPVKVVFDGIEHQGYRIYRMTAPDLLGTEVRLNGETLQVQPDGALPDFVPDLSTSTPAAATLPPASYAFVVFDAAADACMAIP